MRYQRKSLRKAAVRVTICSLLALVGIGVTALGQDAAKNNKQHETRVRGQRDPFVKYRAIAPVPRLAASQIGAPPLQERIARYKSLKAAAMSVQQPVPKPTTALLLNEVQVTGVFRTPRGYAAMVEAMPIKLSYVIYPGEQFYDGQLVAIDDDRLVFRHETRLSNGKKESAVVTKKLRDANAVSDSLTASRNSQPEAPVASSDDTSKVKATSRQ
jgi:hypothetical protein